jgi:hypothetical protein
MSHATEVSIPSPSPPMPSEQAFLMSDAARFAIAKHLRVQSLYASYVETAESVVLEAGFGLPANGSAYEFLLSDIIVGEPPALQ